MPPRTPDDQDALLDSRQVAELLRVHPKHIYRLLKRGLPGHRVGGEWRFRREEVLAWGHLDRAPAPSAAPPVAAPAASPVSRLIAANGDRVVHELLRTLNGSASALWGFVQADRGRALDWLAAGRTLAAGSHGGVPPARVGSLRLARIHLVEREVGLAARPGEKVPSLTALRRLRVAARPPTAGVYAHLADALREAQVPIETALTRSSTFDSHAEVVCAVLRGEADVGLTTRAWAAHCGLPFRALATESYGLLVRSADMGSDAVVELCEAAQSSALRAALGKIAGYDASRAGDIRYDPDPAE